MLSRGYSAVLARAPLFAHTLVQPVTSGRGFEPRRSGHKIEHLSPFHPVSISRRHMAARHSRRRLVAYGWATGPRRPLTWARLRRRWRGATTAIRQAAPKARHQGTIAPSDGDHKGRWARPPGRAGVSWHPRALIQLTKTLTMPPERAGENEERMMGRTTGFRGSFTALVTPFQNGTLDEKAFRALVVWQIDEGTNGLVPVGTTGESPTLSHDEHRQVVEWCIAEARGRVPVIAGAGSNSTREAVELAQHAEKAGANAVLVVTPYYNKPTQEGLYQHFKAINDAIGIPIIIYNIPARSVIDMSVDTMKRLYELKNIAGVKDATASMARVSQQRAALGPEFTQLSGEDATALGFMAHGGHGCISVTSNVAPRLCAEFQSACLRGDYVAALRLQDKLMPLHQSLFIETSPAPVKYALSALGKCDGTVRLPMVVLSEKSKAAVRDAMVHAGLIN
jgi:4-hydroxy-tetrahydrodipicolinate synthase